jgi:hypothetical protein
MDPKYIGIIINVGGSILINLGNNLQVQSCSSSWFHMLSYSSANVLCLCFDFTELRSSRPP